eukprot:518449_1
MDILFDVTHRNIKDSENIKNDYQCKLKHDCVIMKNINETRKHHLLSRVLRPVQQYKVQNDNKSSNMTSKDYGKMELLDLIHVRLFHSEDNYRRTRVDVVAPKLKLEKDNVFKDMLNNDHDLDPFQLFCDSEEYDTEAIYEDLFPDNDSQSNVYYYFKNKLKDDLNKYDLLKQTIAKYTINPPNKQANDRHLIDLDFGDHVTDWNVQPKFHNMKQEWILNEWFPITQDMIDTLYIKSKILANTNKNKLNSNLSTDDVLCVKMYTDTNELQGNFRHAFRTNSDKNRRSQFIHWA